MSCPSHCWDYNEAACRKDYAGFRVAETFTSRYYDCNVCGKKKIEKLRYMHRNAVKLGLVQFPEEWRWGQRGQPELCNLSLRTLGIGRLNYPPGSAF